MVVSVDVWLPASEEEPIVKYSHILNKVILRKWDLFTHLPVPQPLSFHKAHMCFNKLLVETPALGKVENEKFLEIATASAVQSNPQL